MKTDYERLIAHYIAKIIPDLRLVDVCHYVCDLYHGRYANISDVIDSATELYFFPQTVRFAQSGDFHLEWGSPPIILFDMEFFNQGVRALFRLQLKHESFGIELERIRFGNLNYLETPSLDDNITRLSAALSDACLRKNR